MKKFNIIFYFQSVLLLIFLCLSCTVMSDQDEDNEPRVLIQQLKNLGLEELIEVETFNPKAGLAARKVQKLTDTAAALFVLTQEDIRRSGMTSLAEILRMVPGMQVARLDPHQWAVSARGLNEQFASRLLVMVDGRTVYSPMRSEVNWDVQDLLLEDIERIEVIRGPGASLWGANAVNGIINIITKSAKDTQGSMITGLVGNGEERDIIGIRQGGKLTNGGHYRIYGKLYDHDSFTELKSGLDHGNEWTMKQGGFRADWKRKNQDDVHLQGNVYKGSTEKSIFDMLGISDTNMDGVNVLARWQRNSENGEIILQTYYDRTKRDEFSYDEERNTYDLDFQHRFLTRQGHELIWGLGFRYNSDNIETEFPFFQYIPNERQDKLFSAFVQSEFMLNTDWRLTIGSKFEHNDYSGFEIQPTTRLLWNLKDRHILWGAISRAVRTPSRTEEDLLINITRDSPFGQNIEYLKDFELNVQGNKALESELLEAYELGYRYNITNKLLLDASAFYNKYDKMRTVETINFKYFPIPTIFQQFKNQMYGEVVGLELASHWQVKDYWKLITTYSYLNTQLHIKADSVDKTAETLEGYSPTHQMSFRSLINLNSKTELDTALYYTDDLHSQAVSNYIRFDMRLGWHFNNVELNLGVRNLFDSKHNEFILGERGAPILLNEIPRSFYLGLRYDF